MKGAHCLDCLERGPDLVLDVRAVQVPAGCGELIFRCPRCGELVRWHLRFDAEGVVYELPLRLTN